MSKQLLSLLLSFSFLITAKAYSAQTPAEKLTANLPPATIAFIATSGGDALKSSFDKTGTGSCFKAKENSLSQSVDRRVVELRDN